VGWECDSEGSLWQDSESGQYGISTKHVRKGREPTIQYTGQEAIDFLEDRLNQYQRALDSHWAVLQLFQD